MLREIQKNQGAVPGKATKEMCAYACTDLRRTVLEGVEADQATPIEIDENLIRAELTPAEQYACRAPDLFAFKKWKNYCSTKSKAPRYLRAHIYVHVVTARRLVVSPREILSIGFRI